MHDVNECPHCDRGTGVCVCECISSVYPAEGHVRSSKQNLCVCVCVSLCMCVFPRENMPPYLRLHRDIHYCGDC